MIDVASSLPERYIGLDVHKHYLVAAGVDAARQPVLGPQRVPLARLERWIARTLTPRDAVVLEMTCNTYQLYDDLLPHVLSVTRGPSAARQGHHQCPRHERQDRRLQARRAARRGPAHRHLGSAAGRA